MTNKKKTAVIIVASVAVFIMIWNILKSPLEKTAAACQKYSLPYWKLEYVEEQTEERCVTVVYKRINPGAEKGNICIKKTCDALNEILLKSEDSKYHDYSITIRFRSINSAEDFGVYNLTADLTTVRIYNFGMTSMPLKTIVECFPYTKELSVAGGVSYDDTIENIRGFENLEYFECTDYLSKEEKEYIHSLYPDCVIECLGES